jgi:hypothetical protein
MAKSKLAEIKTKPTEVSVTDFIAQISDETKRKDSETLMKLISKVSKLKPAVWGSSIIGFGNVIFKSPGTGREVAWFVVGFAPRKSNLTIYMPGNIASQHEALKKLGKHKTGGGCLYINKLSDVDLKILEGMIKDTVKNQPK